jgi:hypothetical protein
MDNLPHHHAAFAITIKPRLHEQRLKIIKLSLELLTSVNLPLLHVEPMYKDNKISFKKIKIGEHLYYRD